MNAILTKKIQKIPPFKQLLEACQNSILEIKPKTGRHIDEFIINTHITVPFTFISVGIWGAAAILSVLLSPLYAVMAIAPFFLPIVPKLLLLV